MKDGSLPMPDKLADFLEDTAFPADLQVRSLLLLLYPFMEDNLLTQKEVADLMGMPEADVRFIYDHYQLSKGTDASWNHAEEEYQLLKEFDEAKKNASESKKTEDAKGLTQQEVLMALQEFVATLQGIYADSLLAVILFGSYARGDYTKDSDIDVLILLDSTEEKLRKHDDALFDAAYRFDIKHDTDLEPVTASIQHFRKWQQVLPFYRNILQDGIWLYEHDPKNCC